MKTAAQPSPARKNRPHSRRGKANTKTKGSRASKKRTSAPALVHPDAAGIDLGSRHHFVAVPPGRDQESVRSFATDTPSLRKLVAWLESCGVRTVAMEATGVYWEPVYALLEEAGLQP